MAFSNTIHQDPLSFVNAVNRILQESNRPLRYRQNNRKWLLTQIRHQEYFPRRRIYTKAIRSEMPVFL